MVIFTGIMILMIIFCFISFIHAHIAKEKYEKYHELLEQPITTEAALKRLLPIKAGIFSWLIVIIAMAQFFSILILVVLFISTTPENVPPLIAILVACTFVMFSLFSFTGSLVDSIQAAYSYEAYADKVSQYLSEQKSGPKSSHIDQKPFHKWLGDLAK